MKTKYLLSLIKSSLSYFPLTAKNLNCVRLPRLETRETLISVCVCVCVCADCRSTGAYWPHTPVVAWNRVAWTQLNWILLSPAAVSHTCCSCVHHSLCPTSKLHQSDKFLHQQSKLLWSPESLSPVCQPEQQQQQQPTQSTSQIPCHTHMTQPRSKQPAALSVCRDWPIAAARVALTRAAFSIAVARDVLTSATISHAHWSAAQPEQLALYATWDQAAIVGVTLARGALTAAIIHTKWDLTGPTKSPSKHLIHKDSQQDPKLITGLFKVTLTSSQWRKSDFHRGRGKDIWERWRIMEKLWILFTCMYWHSQIQIWIYLLSSAWCNERVMKFDVRLWICGIHICSVRSSAWSLLSR